VDGEHPSAACSAWAGRVVDFFTFNWVVFFADKFAPCAHRPTSTVANDDRETDILDQLASTPTVLGRADRQARRPIPDVSTPTAVPVAKQNVRTPTRSLITPGGESFIITYYFFSFP